MDAPSVTGRGRLHDVVPTIWVIALALLIMAPTLVPGFTLSYDLVFTPQQDLLPSSLGWGGGLPRAVPQDAVVALVEYVVPGMIVEKFVLLAIPIVAGLGMVRLLRNAGTIAQVVAATCVIVNPFVAERLVIGHWGFLLAYAVCPWAIAVAQEVRRGRPGAGVRLVLLVALGALTPSGALLVGLLSVPMALAPGSALAATRRVWVGVGAVIVMLPWIVPAALHPAATSVDPLSTSVFGLRSEGLWGVIVTAVSGGGIWNSQAVPASRGWWTAPIIAVALVLLAVWGWSSLRTILGRAVTSWWVIAAAGGLVLALASALVPSIWGDLVSVVPGAGLLRDAHKMLAPLVLLLAAAAGTGGQRLLSHISDVTIRRSLLVLAVAIPLVALPDIAWGVGGRLTTSTYPADWAAVRERLAPEEGPGDVVVLPWSTFRRFDWNADRTVLDPAPRWLPRTSIVSDALTVGTPSGLITIRGDDPRAQQVSELLDRHAPAADYAAMGVGWVVREVGQVPDTPLPEGLAPVLTGGQVELYAVSGPLTAPQTAASAYWVVATDLVVALLLGILGVAAFVGAVRRNRRASALGL